MQPILRRKTRTCVPPTLGPYLLPHVVPDLHRAYPDLKLYVREGCPDDLMAELLDCTFDLLAVPLPVSDEAVETNVLFREPLMVVCAPDQPLASRKSSTRDDLNLLGFHRHIGLA